MAIVRTTPTSPGENTPEKKSATAERTAGRGPREALARPGARPLASRTTAPVKPGNAGQFISETQTELRRVVWPTRVEVNSGTIVTIGLLVFFAFYIYGLDFVMEKLFMLLGLYGGAVAAK